MVRKLTREDKVGFPGYVAKAEDDCPFIQRKVTDADIFGHDDYDSFCTKDRELKPIMECIACKKCNYTN